MSDCCALPCAIVLSNGPSLIFTFTRGFRFSLCVDCSVVRCVDCCCYLLRVAAANILDLRSVQRKLNTVFDDLSSVVCNVYKL